MEKFKEIIDQVDDPKIRDSLNRAFAAGVELGAMVTQYAVNSGSLIARQAAELGATQELTKQTSKNAD